MRSLRILRHAFLAWACLGCWGIAQPAEAQKASTCEVRDTSGMVTLVLCPPGLDTDALRAAGVAACKGRMPCGAWIWDSPARMPTTAPDRHDALPPEAIAAAKAIWVEESQSLITLEKVLN